MRKNTKKHTLALAAAALALNLLFSPLLPAPDAVRAQQTTDSQSILTDKEKQMVAAFEERVKEYVKLREGLEEKMPKLSKEAKPEQIEAHKAAFQESVRTARAGAQPGQMFTADIAAHIRATIRDEFKGRDMAELRQTIFEAETDGVTVRVNYPYPEAKELVEMPPTLLLRLPQLPKQIRYRFVGRNMLLVDRENSLIIDYMTDAIP